MINVWLAEAAAEADLAYFRSILFTPLRFPKFS